MSIDHAPNLTSGEFGELQPPVVETGLPEGVADAVAVGGLKNIVADRTSPSSILAGGAPEVRVYEPLTPNQALQDQEAAAERAVRNVADGYF